MEGEIFSKGNLTNLCDPNDAWTESQYNQLKNQIVAYKYLMRNMNVPSDVIEKIRSYENDEWDKIREKNMTKVQETYEKRFESHDLVS
jgi:hypothetical protein